MASRVKYASDLDILVNVDDRGTTEQLRSLESSIIRFVGAVASATTLLAGIAFPVREAADFEAELLNVKKTTGFSTEQIKDLGDSLLVMSQNVNIGATDLAKVAAIAGQLGLGAKGGAEAIAAFTDTAARFASVLDVTVETAANDIAKITNVFGIAINEAERISAAINEVSNNSTAAGSDILDIVNRVGNIGGINLSDAIGIAAFSKDVGQANEVASTSFSKMIANLTVRAEQFANLMGVTTEEWVNIVNRDAIGALQSVAEHLNGMGTAASNAFVKTNIGGGRIFALFDKLRQSSELLDVSRNRAAVAFIEGTSSIREQENVLSGLNAQAKIMLQNFQNLAEVVGVDALPTLKRYVKEWSDFLKDPVTIKGAKELGAEIGHITEMLLKAVKAVAANTDTWKDLLTVIELLIGLKVISVFSNMSIAAYKQVTSVLALAKAYRAAQAAQRDYLITGQAANLGGASKIFTGADGKAGASAGSVFAAGLGAAVANTKQGITELSSASRAAAQAIKTDMLSVAAAGSKAKTLLVDRTASEASLAARKANATAEIAIVKQQYAAGEFASKQAYLRRVSDLNKELAAVKTTTTAMRNASTKAINEVALAQQAAIARVKASIASLAATGANTTSIAALKAELAATQAIQTANGRVVGGFDQTQAVIRNNAAQLGRFNAGLRTSGTLTAALRAGVVGVGSAIAFMGRGLLAAIPILGQVVTIGWLAYEAYKALWGTTEKSNAEEIRSNAIREQAIKTLDRQAEAAAKYNEELGKASKLNQLGTAGIFDIINAEGSNSLASKNTEYTKQLADATSKQVAAIDQINEAEADRSKLLDTNVMLSDKIKQRTEKIAELEDRINKAKGTTVGTYSIDKMKGRQKELADEIKTLGDALNVTNGRIATQTSFLGSLYDASNAASSQMTALEKALKGRYQTNEINFIAKYTNQLVGLGQTLRGLDTQQDAVAKLIKDGTELSKITFSPNGKDILTGKQAIDALAISTDAARKRMTDAVGEMNADIAKMSTQSGEDLSNVGKTVLSVVQALETMSKDGTSAAKEFIAIMNRLNDSSLPNLDSENLAAGVAMVAQQYKALDNVIRLQLRPNLAESERLNKSYEDSFIDLSKVADNSLRTISSGFEEIIALRRSAMAEEKSNNAIDNGATSKRLQQYKDELASVRERVSQGVISVAQGKILESIAQKNIRYSEEALSKEKAAASVKLKTAEIVRVQEETMSKLAIAQGLLDNGNAADAKRLLDEATASKDSLLELYKQIAAVTYDKNQLKGGTVAQGFISEEWLQGQKTRLNQLDKLVTDSSRKILAQGVDLTTAQVNVQRSVLTEAETSANNLKTTLDKLSAQSTDLKTIIDSVRVNANDTEKLLNTQYKLFSTVNTGGDLLDKAKYAEAIKQFAEIKEKTTQYTDDLNKLFTNSTAVAGNVRNAIEEYRAQMLAEGNRVQLDLTKGVAEEIIKGLVESQIKNLNVGVDPTLDEAQLTQQIRNAIETPKFKINGDLIIAPAEIDAVVGQLSGRISSILNGLPKNAAGGMQTTGMLKGKGTGTSDSFLSWLSNGEYVMPARIVSMFGRGFFDMLRMGQMPIPRFAAGGAAVQDNNQTTGGGVQLLRVLDNDGSEYTLFTDARGAAGMAGLINRVGRSRG